MTKNIIILISICFIFQSQFLFAGYFKCTNAKGKVTFQAKPCSNESKSTKIKQLAIGKGGNNLHTIETDKINVKSATYKISNKSSSYWYFNWKVDLFNKTNQDVYVTVKVIFVDSNGYQIDYDIESDVRVRANKYRTITDREIIENKLASQVTKMKLEVTE